MRRITLGLVTQLAVAAALLTSCGGGGSSDSGGSSGSTSPASFTISVAVSGLSGTGLVLQNNGGDNLTISAPGTFTFATTVAAGAAYKVTVLTQPGSPAQGCGLTTASGTASANVTLTVSCYSRGRFAYVSNGADGTISGYSINQTTGALTALPASPFAVTGAVQLGYLAIDPSARFVYANDRGVNGFFGFTINETTGALTQMSSPNFSLSNRSETIATDPSGKYLYVGGTSQVYGFALDPATGMPQPLSSGATITGNDQLQLTISGHFLYVSFLDSNVAADNGIDGFSIAPATGTLTGIDGGGDETPNSHAASIVVNPAGTVAFAGSYAVGLAPAAVSAYAVNPPDGFLNAYAGDPESVQVGGNIGMDSRGRFLLVPDTGGISVYPFDSASGAIGNSVSGAHGQGGQPISVVADPTDRFVYVPNDSLNEVFEYTLDDNTGALAAVAGSPVAAGHGALYMAID